MINDLSSAMRDLLSKVSSVDVLRNFLRDVNAYPIKSRPASEPSHIAASDSSRVVKKLSFATVYAIQSVAVRASLKDPPDSRLIVKSFAGYHTPTPGGGASSELVERILKLTSRTLEVKSMIELLSDGEVVLFDGSLISFLWGYSNKKIPKGFYPAFYKSIRDIWYEIYSGIVEVTRVAKPLFISKTLMRNYYTDILLSHDVPKKVKAVTNDLMLINALRRLGRLPKTPYILQPVHVERDNLPRPLTELDVDLSPFTPVTITYVSFNPSTQPYQISIPGKVGIDELVELVSEIYPYSHTGYPDPLKVAHNMCRLSNTEFRTVLYKLGLSSIPTGRELLGEFL